MWPPLASEVYCLWVPVQKGWQLEACQRLGQQMWGEQGPAPKYLASVSG